MNQDIKYIQGSNCIEEINIVKELSKGHSLLKYGRKGKPHIRHIYLSELEDKINWKIAENNNNETVRYIKISDITEVKIGYNSTDVLKKNKVPKEFNHLCFSLISKKRTLDVKCDNMQQKKKWVGFI